MYKQLYGGKDVHKEAHDFDKQTKKVPKEMKSSIQSNNKRSIISNHSHRSGSKDSRTNKINGLLTNFQKKKSVPSNNYKKVEKRFHQLYQVGKDQIQKAQLL